MTDWPGQERLAALSEFSTDAVMLVSGEGLILWASESTREVLGYEPAALVGTRARDLVVAEDLDAWKKMVAELVARPAVPFSGGYRCRHLDGSARWTFGTARNLLTEPRIGAVVVYFRDVTPAHETEARLQPAIFATVMDLSDRLRLEEQLRLAQKMEAIGRLAGGIAHDFNNLLTAIRGNAELLSYRLKGDTMDLTEVDEILLASDRAASLTRQLLAFSRRQDVINIKLNVNELVENVARMARRLIGPDVQLEIQRDAALSPVLADPGQVEQILLNLVVNARDALPERGRIRVRTDNATLDDGSSECVATGLAPGQYVRLHVSDDGIGMDQATQTRIFEPFFTTKEPGRGTGLGLSTVYGILRQMGGAVLVESERDHGATFTVYLRAAAPDPVSVRQEA